MRRPVTQLVTSASWSICNACIARDLGVTRNHVAVVRYKARLTVGAPSSPRVCSRCPRHAAEERLVARFFAMVDIRRPDECWPWIRARRSAHAGYGDIWLSGKNRIASRVSWALFNGPVPAGLIVRHLCDNPPCVNPMHLAIGTHKDNAQDAKASRLRRQQAGAHMEFAR